LQKTPCVFNGFEAFYEPFNESSKYIICVDLFDNDTNKKDCKRSVHLGIEEKLK
jgi:hypothetical protein